MNKKFSISKSDLSKHEFTYLSKECKNIKEKSQSIDSFAELVVKKKIKIEINKKIIEKIFDNIVSKTISITEQLLNDCQVELDEIDGFILVGGSTNQK